MVKKTFTKKCFEEILDNIDLENFTNQTQGKAHDKSRIKSDYEIVEKIVTDAQEKAGLLPVPLQVMLEQYFWADEWMREIDKSRWIYRVTNRESEDFFPDSMTVYMRLFDG